MHNGNEENETFPSQVPNAHYVVDDEFYQMVHYIAVTRFSLSLLRLTGLSINFSDMQIYRIVPYQYQIELILSNHLSVWDILTQTRRSVNTVLVRDVV